MFEMQEFNLNKKASSSRGSERLEKGRWRWKPASVTSTSIFTLLAFLLAHSLGPTIAEITSPPTITKQPPADVTVIHVAQQKDESDKPVIIECEAEGLPEPQYTWIKNGQPFDWQVYDDRMEQEQGRGTLKINKPRDEDIGQYQCFATNSFGTATSNSVFLRKAELHALKDSVQVQIVSADEGKPFSLPCNQAPEGWPKPRVDWMYQNSQGAVKNINSSRMTVGPEGTLWFSSVTEEDQSLDFNLACSSYSSHQHEYKLGNRVYLNVNLINATHKHPPTQQYMSSSTTVAIRGDTLELWCIVGGTPLPEIRWDRKGSRLPPERYRLENDGKTMRISDITFGDAGTYYCDASNGVGQQVSHSIEVSVEAAPYFVAEPEDAFADEDETVVFNCTAGGVPIPVINWIHNGKPIEEALPNPRRTVEENKITITNILKNDTGNYGCNVSNSYGYAYKDVYVNVQALPPIVKDGPKDVVAMEGAPAVFTCRVYGAPKPTLRWIRDDQEVTGGKFQALSTGDLNITAVDFEDSGSYSCYAVNKFGNASATGSLDVKARTVINEAPEDNQLAAGNPVKFGCNAKPDDTLPMTIDWLHNGVPIQFSDNPGYAMLPDNSLTIDNAAVADSGDYTCVAKTQYDSVSAAANLIIQDVPNRPEIMGIECQPTTATVRWKGMGDNYAEILQYIVQFNTTFTPDWEVADKVAASENDYTMSMSPWANYTFRVIARNSIGPSIPSGHSEVCLTSEDVPFGNPENVKADKAEPHTLRITWDPMSEIEHNAPQLRYEVQWKEDDDKHHWETDTTSDWRQSEYVVHNQPIYLPYLFKVRAINAKGESNVVPGIHRGYSGQAVPTQAPSNFTLKNMIDSVSALVSWDPVEPESLQGKFEGYKIETWKETDEADSYRTITTNYDVTEAIVDNLVPYSRNYLRVYAYNTYHPGPYSIVLEVITDEGRPGPVAELEVRPLGTSSLYVTWDKPEQPNGIVLGYIIKYVRVVGKEVKWGELAERQPVIMDPKILSAKLTDLQANTTYRVFVAAITKVGAGEETYVPEKTFADDAIAVAKPTFLWERVRSQDELAAVRVLWKPNFETIPAGPGSRFYVQYRKYGETDWTSEPEVLNEDFYVLGGLTPGETYIIRVVAVDGDESMPSEEQKAFIDAVDAPTRLAKEAKASSGWFLGFIIALAFLVFVFIFVSIVRRNRGGKYAVHDREVAHGHLNYDESGFKELPTEEPSIGSDVKRPQGSDSDSMTEDRDEDTKFTEDGSFIGEYA